MAKIIERWRLVSLRTRLFAQFSAFLGISLVIFLYTTVQTIEASIQVELQERQDVAQLLADRVDIQLDQALQAMLGFLVNNESLLKQSLRDLKENPLPHLFADSILFKRVFLLDNSGQILWMDPFNENMAGVNITNPPYNRSLEGLNQPAFFPTIGRQSKNPGVVLIVPLSDNYGSNNGFLLGWIDFGEPRARSLLYPYEPGSKGYTDLVDEKGIVLASTDPERIGRGSDHAGYLSELVEHKQSAVGSCHSCHNSSQIFFGPSSTRTDEILAFAPLAHIPWGLVLRQPEAEVFSNTKILSQRLIILGLVILAAFFGLVWVTTRDIIRPMQLLSRACQQIAAGDLSQPIPDIGVAETASLAHSFEGMRRDLLNYQEKMLASQRELETRVEERTSELTRYRDYLLTVNHNLTTLNKIAVTLVQDFDLSETLHLVLEQILNTLSGDAAGILLLDESRGFLVLTDKIGLTEESLSTIDHMTFADLFPGKYHTHPAVDKHEWHFACSQVLDKSLKFKSMLIIPLEEKSKFIGELFIAANQPEHFTAEDEALMHSIGWQISTSIRNARLYEAVQRKEQERAELLHRVIAAQEEERKRIARELHDDTSQGLTTLILGLDTLDAALGVDPREATALQNMNKAIAKQMLEDIRRITTDLRPSLLDDLGLVPAIAWYGEKRLNPLGIALHLHGQDLEENRLPQELEILLFRIIQEAITNVIRHANASEVTVWFMEEDHTVTVQISDDGKGFDLQMIGAIDTQGRGLGLRGMRERANLIGGELDIQSAIGLGTTILVRVPLNKGN